MTRSKKFTEADYARIAEMRERGDTYDTIASKFNCSAGAIAWHCLRLGADLANHKLRPDYHLKQPVMKRGNHMVRAFTPEEDARLIELSLARHTLTEIGRTIGRRRNSCLGRLMILARRDERAERGLA